VTERTLRRRQREERCTRNVTEVSPSGGGTSKRLAEGDIDGPERGEPHIANASAKLAVVTRIAAIAATRLVVGRGTTFAVSVS
jgi:hypothetical protein